MVKVVNPFNRKEEEFVSAANLCNCICNKANDNNSSGRWVSKFTFNIVCGCACNSDIADNKSANNNKDKNR